jgi:hypothetical protein
VVVDAVTISLIEELMASYVLYKNLFFII